MFILSDPRSADDDRPAPPRVSASDPLVDLIRGQHGMAERLIAQHVDDGHGRCAVCRGGAQTGRYAWPCTTARAAATARAAGPRGDGSGEVGRGPTGLDGGGIGEVRPVRTDLGTGRADFGGADPARTCHGRDDFGSEIRRGVSDFRGEISHAVNDLDTPGGAR